ncbi:hypothetical protein LUZ61_003477 [Rhynchospora tenuis]|uniref:GTP-binding protein sar1 n=1 Tax=Rhynchospora tenuis TaxID=198213 RepID=A0AAD5ZKV3_9POAL|nr:hypothetical protein LUZ61_003477 [Rhynchospora tenuis]
MFLVDWLRNTLDLLYLLWEDGIFYLGLHNYTVVDRFCDVLASLGLWQEAKILFLGLENAGKTSLLQELRNEFIWKSNARHAYTVMLPLRNYEYHPTQHPTSEKLSIGKMKFQVFDLGGQQIVRHFWKLYSAKVDAIVYLVDAYDKNRFAESKKELHALLSDKSLATVPFLILGNKADIPYAASEKELRSYMGLSHDFTTGKGKVKLANSNVRPIEIFMCSADDNMGYDEGIQVLQSTWLVSPPAP